MTGLPARPPRGLRWTDAGLTRALTTLLAILGLLLAIYVGYRQQVYINCVADQQRADQQRTAAIARATDDERIADRRLLSGPVPGGPSAEQLKQGSIAARATTDAVRAENPPPPPGAC